MKKYIIITLLAVATVSHGIVVNGGPIVVQDATRAQIDAQAGSNDTPWRVIAVTDEPGILSVYDGSTSNWTDVGASSTLRNYWVQYSGTDTTNMGTAVTTAYAKLKASVDAGGFASTAGPILNLEAGTHTFGANGLTANSRVSIVGAGGSGVYGQHPHGSFYSLAWTPMTVIEGTGATALIDTAHHSRYEEILFNGDVYLPSAGDAVFKNCIVGGDVDSDGAASQPSYLINSKVTGDFYPDSKEAFLIDNSSVGGRVGRGESGLELQPAKILRSHIGGTSNFLGQALFSSIHVEIRDSIVSGDHAFLDYNNSGAVHDVACYNTTFYDTTTDWFNANGNNEDADGLRFYNCQGISSSLTNTAATIRNCTDETGADIPNQ